MLHVDHLLEIFGFPDYHLRTVIDTSVRPVHFAHMAYSDFGATAFFERALPVGADGAGRLFAIVAGRHLLARLDLLLAGSAVLGFTSSHFNYFMDIN